MKQSSKHVHQYEKVKWGEKGTVIWKCVVINCSHYLHVEFILGKQSVCWKCGDKFIMTAPKLLRQRPKCDKCQHSSGQGPSKGIKKQELPDLSNINIDDLLENL